MTRGWGCQLSPAYLFPDDFFWGTAASAYQVEGNNRHTDWFAMEAAEQRKPPAKRRIKEPCGAACDHWRRYAEDYDLARQLGVQVHRLSVDWARVCPSRDELDEGALEHYREMLLALRSRGIKVMLCLSHLLCQKPSHGYIGRAAVDHSREIPGL
ncbi:MAG: family 1 glycosylhydrolase [Bacillota bacterium]